MAISNYASYKARIESPNVRISFCRQNINIPVGRLGSMWIGGTAEVGSGSAPTTAVAPTKATVGSLPGFRDGATAAWFVGATPAKGTSGGFLLCDRLSHQGGLSGSNISSQTTNLPTAALTRYTSGEGVMAAFEIYSAVGTTATTITASYTNSSGTASRTTLATNFGATGFREAGRIIPFNLQQGDTGVRSVESVTVLTTTDATGAFGITLFKPLAFIPIDVPFGFAAHDGLLTLGGVCPEIVDDACLFYLVINSGSGSTNSQMGEFLLAED